MYFSFGMQSDISAQSFDNSSSPAITFRIDGLSMGLGAPNQGVTRGLMQSVYSDPSRGAQCNVSGRNVLLHPKFHEYCYDYMAAQAARHTISEYQLAVSFLLQVQTRKVKAEHLILPSSDFRTPYTL